MAKDACQAEGEPQFICHSSNVEKQNDKDKKRDYLIIV